jgi:hypothetical protein
MERDSIGMETQQYFARAGTKETFSPILGR